MSYKWNTTPRLPSFNTAPLRYNQEQQLEEKRKQLANQTGGDYSAWTPENKNVYNYNQNNTKTNKSENSGYRSSAASPSRTEQINSIYQQQLAAQAAAQERQAALLREQYERRKAAEEAARKQQEDALKKGYDSMMNAAQGSYDSMAALRQQGYETATSDVNAAAERAMQQAYISNEMQKRYLGQQLAAQGRSGGASESAMLGMANAYGSERGRLDTNRNNQLSDLASQLAEGKAKDLDTFNRAKAEYENEYQKRLAALAAQSADRVLSFDTSFTDNMIRLEQQAAAQKAQIEKEQQMMLLKAQSQRGGGQKRSGGKRPASVKEKSAGRLSESGQAWMMKMNHNIRTNPISRKKTEDELKQEIKHAVHSAYLQEILSAEDAQHILRYNGI